MARITRSEQVISYIRKHPGCTREEIASALDTCYVYISTRVAELAEAGTVIQEEGERTRRGRRPYLLTIA